MENNERDLYNDNILDVHSIEDIKDLDTLNLLSKKDDNSFQFELGSDFWKLENGKLYQYADFVSMEQDNGKLVYDISSSEFQGNKIYGKLIVDAIEKENSFKTMPPFSLKERSNYIKNADKSVDKTIKLPFRIDTKNLQQKSQKLDEITNKAFESIDKQETKPVLDLVKMVIKALSLLLISVKRNKIDYKKDELINKIIKGLDDKTLDISKILKDPALNREIPELPQILNRYKEQFVSVDLKSQKESVSKLLDDKELVDVCDKLSENNLYKQEVSKAFFKEITKNLDTILENDYENKMKKAFSSSQSANSFEYSKELLLKNLEDIYSKNKKISQDEYGLSVAFLSQMLDEKENKILLTEVLSQTYLEKMEQKDSKLLSTIQEIAEQCIKNELSLNKTQQKHL